jgi:hypothetical protein
MSRDSLRLRHPQDLGTLGLPSDSAAWADDWNEPGSLEARQNQRRTKLERSAARRLGPARARDLIYPLAFLTEARERGTTFELVLDDYAAGCFLYYCGVEAEAKFTLSFKNCRRVQWLVKDESRPRKIRKSPTLRPSSTQNLAKLLPNSGYESSPGGISLREDGQGMHLDLRAGWVESFNGPFVWMGRFAVWNLCYVVVECDRVVVLDEREAILRETAGEDAAQSWLTWRRLTPPDRYSRPEDWIEASSLPDLRHLHIPRQ